MNITIAGSLGNISRILVGKLVAEGHSVKVISSNAERAEAIEQLHAIPLTGSLEDADFVSESFRGADVVYTMVPPDFFVADYYQFAHKIHQNYVQAIEQNNIQHAVNLSSIGVAFAGMEPFKKYYDLEKRLNEIPGLNIVHLRPAMFYTNFYGGLELVKQQGIIGHNVAGTVDLLMTHPADIADTAFLFLNSPSFSGQHIKYVISDVKNGGAIAEMLSNAIGKPVNWVEFADDLLLESLLKNGFSEEAAGTYIVSAGKAIREGLFDEYKKEEYKLAKSRQFSDFAQEFAQTFSQVYANS